MRDVTLTLTLHLDTKRMAKIFKETADAYIELAEAMRRMVNALGEAATFDDPNIHDSYAWTGRS